MKTYIYVTPFFPSPTSWRGAYCLDFVKALKRALEVKDQGEQWKVVVFTEGDGSDYEIEGVKVRTFKAKYLPSNIFPFLFKKFNQHSFLDKVKEVGEGEQWNVDDICVCHCHTANFAIYAEAMKKVNPKCKTLLHHHDLQSFGLNMGRLRHFWLYNLIQFPILRRLHEQIDTHVFISEAARRSFLAAPDTSWTVYEDYKKQMRGLPYRSVRIKNSVILHNGVDKKIFSRVERVERVDFVIGCVGNFQKLKGQITLLKAIQILSTRSTSLHGKKIKVVFVGSRDTLDECKRFAAKNGLDVEFKSEVKHEKLADFYRSLDLFVLPSTFEGFGCVYTEAHSCGVPFIACEGQGTDDIIPIEDRNKWLCKQRDPVDLARKIGDYISRVERGERVEQRLNEDQDIDALVGKFVDSLHLHLNSTPKSVAFYMNCVSTHQLPLAKEVAAIVDEFTYVYEAESGQAFQQAEYEKATRDMSCLETVDVVLTGLRDLDLFERRAKKGLKTFYTSERWFKPRLGALRMLVPSYRKMVKRFVKWANEDPGARVLAIGPHAKRDFLRMGVNPDKLVPWGYYVAPSTARRKAPPQEPPLNTAHPALSSLRDSLRSGDIPSLGLSVSSSTSQTSQTSRTSQTARVLRVLWAGRDIPLKHVGDIERAVALANKNLESSVHLHLGSSPISFTKLTGVTPAEVRAAMRSHDTFVFASNGFEGWGAVVSEALEEGMNAIGTYECGAPPTLLPKERLYHCGDVKALARLLEAEYRGELPQCEIGEWTAQKAAQRLINLI